ncbi:hypothetical protein GGR54DRAFT_607746 [Hypoxylon sp. NC1633]|nr:hypothetical protein GGR54DRAFT_607746 [Hypoxylon sp. NC1633]
MKTMMVMMLFSPLKPLTCLSVLSCLRLLLRHQTLPPDVIYNALPALHLCAVHTPGDLGYIYNLVCRWELGNIVSKHKI